VAGTHVTDTDNTKSYFFHFQNLTFVY
jgi:hypothetical protein